MLATIHAEALGRIAATRSFVRVVEAQETATGGDPASRSGKGLVFVQNYAVYEYVVVQAVRAMITEANSRALTHATARTELLALALNPEFGAVIGGALRKTWESRAMLLRRARSTDTVEIHDGLFPKDGSQFRMPQLQTLWSLFGLPPPVLPVGRLIGRVGEMVDNRNRIAHGEEPAEDVGRRYTIAEIRDRIDDTEALCSHLVAVIGAYLGEPTAFQ
jgi:hypothetical protein